MFATLEEFILFIEKKNISRDCLFNNKYFLKEKNIWNRNANNSSSNFFSHTSLLILLEEFILLLSFDNNHSLFLNMNYSLEEQNICIKLFGSKKNILIVNNEDLINHNNSYNSYNDVNLYILFKDEETIKKNIFNYLPKFFISS